MSKIITFAGLPGAGKTTLARLLARRLDAVLLNKDEVRAALFAPDDVDYSARQNDFCMEVIYRLSAYHLQQAPHRPVIIDGRTFSKRAQIAALLKAVELIHCQVYVIECKCSDTTAMARLAQDQGKHVAADRSVTLYDLVKGTAEPLELPRLEIATDVGSTEEHLAMILQYVQ